MPSTPLWPDKFKFLIASLKRFRQPSFMPVASITKKKCYHCGEDCIADNIRLEERIFCCEGCRMVYQIINQKGLCGYYDLNNNPGTSRRISVRKDKFAFLDDKKISRQLISFENEEQTRVTFYLPQI